MNNVYRCPAPRDVMILLYFFKLNESYMEINKNHSTMSGQ